MALTRGVLTARNTEIILLDEPTSRVDLKTELQIYQKFLAEFLDKIMFPYLHLLHLLSHFDYVYVLDKARLVAKGTFDSLKNHNPIFQALWEHQENVSRIDNQV